MELTQVEQDRQEFIRLLHTLQEQDPDGFPALCEQLIALFSGNTVSEVENDE